MSKSDLMKIDHHYQKYHQFLRKHRLRVKKYKQQSNNYETREGKGNIKLELLKYGTENAKEIATVYTNSKNWRTSK